MLVSVEVPSTEKLLSLRETTISLKPRAPALPLKQSRALHLDTPGIVCRLGTLDGPNSTALGRGCAVSSNLVDTQFSQLRSMPPIPVSQITDFLQSRDGAPFCHLQNGDNMEIKLAPANTELSGS